MVDSLDQEFSGLDALRAKMWVRRIVRDLNRFWFSSELDGLQQVPGYASGFIDCFSAANVQALIWIGFHGLARAPFAPKVDGT